MNELIEKAKNYPQRKYNNFEYSPNEVELALEWLKGGITLRQVLQALERGKSLQTAVNFLNKALKIAYREGKLKIKS
jgi:hypothetical protein